MHFSIRTSVRTYKSKSCVGNSYTPWWILVIPTHSDQLDMKMTVKIGFCDVASLTWVMGLCHWGGPCPADTFIVCFLVLLCFIHVLDLLLTLHIRIYTNKLRNVFQYFYIAFTQSFWNILQDIHWGQKSLLYWMVLKNLFTYNPWQVELK